MTDRQFILRSLMFVPGHNEKLLLSAARSNADAILLDLEDSVRSKENKQIARDKIQEKVTSGLFNKFAVFPRVNDRQSGHLLKDVYQLTIEGIAGFMYPKSVTGQDIYFFDKLLETIESEKGYPIGTFKIIALIETTAAVLNAQDICKASDRVIALAFGCEDFVSDLEGVHDLEGQSIRSARALIAMAARANGVIPIDTVHIHVHDLQDLEKNVKFARILGFEGMLILHPKEIEIAHRYFTPSEQEVEDAREMLRLAKEVEEQGRGVAVINGKFIGPPMVVAAKKLLERHRAIMKKYD
ncbi:MAG: CoA ester lyase [Methanoregula sp.]|nr:CoA ester lyase [Methanoregula sp.]